MDAHNAILSEFKARIELISARVKPPTTKNIIFEVDFSIVDFLLCPPMPKESVENEDAKVSPIVFSCSFSSGKSLENKFLFCNSLLNNPFIFVNSRQLF